MSNSNHGESLRWNTNTHFLFQNSGRSPLRERARGCWPQIGEKCYWLSGKGRLRPSGRLRHRLGATPSVWTRCSAHRTTTTSLSVQESLLRWFSQLYWFNFWERNPKQVFLDYVKCLNCSFSFIQHKNLRELLGISVDPKAQRSGLEFRF